MSKIFDALKKAESAHAKYGDTRAAGAGSAKQPNRRRTGRVNVRVPLFVYGYTLEGDPFYEEAYTIAINAQGALISMRNMVQPGQRLVVVNKGDKQTQECVVLSVRARPARGVDVAFEFLTPMPYFWRNLDRQKPGP